MIPARITKINIPKLMTPIPILNQETTIKEVKKTAIKAIKQISNDCLLVCFKLLEKRQLNL